MAGFAAVLGLLVAAGSACNDAVYSDRSIGITPQATACARLSALMVRTGFAIRGAVINGYPGAGLAFLVSPLRPNPAVPTHG